MAQGVPTHAPRRPEELEASLAASEFEMTADLKGELDEITEEYRFGDSAR
jgi:hypothetical protein